MLGEFWREFAKPNRYPTFRQKWGSFMTSNREITIHRGRRVRNFTVVNNQIIEARHLSVRARLALIYLLSKPDDWALQITDLRRVLGVGEQDLGRDTVYAVVAELVQAGYIEKRQVVDARSRFQGLRYTVWDEPVTSPEEGGPGGQQGGGEARRPDSGPARPLPENQETVVLGGLGAYCGDESAPFPEIQETVETPLPDFPDAVDQHLTKDGFSPRTSPPPSPESQRHGREGAEEEFQNFWDAWPETERPQFKAAAKKHVLRLSAEERCLACEIAPAYRALRRRSSTPTLMIPFLKAREFGELANAPPLDAEGYFRIHPGREEWMAWVGHYSRTFGAQRVQSLIDLGFMLTPTRWPPLVVAAQSRP